MAMQIDRIRLTNSMVGGLVGAGCCGVASSVNASASGLVAEWQHRIADVSRGSGGMSSRYSRALNPSSRQDFSSDRIDAIRPTGFFRADVESVPAGQEHRPDGVLLVDVVDLQQPEFQVFPHPVPLPQGVVAGFALRGGWQHALPLLDDRFFESDMIGALGS